ncbi:hypothetical protein ACI2L4_25015 [Streptomyces sparsogenes]|uniref:hypothetical protein n=1 Tax=Streptomyces sparsogenes TaxID=67365 RepID=UPI00384E59AC
MTPEMASSWLSYRDHPSNRPISKSVTARYQEDMAAGRWREATPEGYIFDTNGYWISGRHRAKAQANGNFTLKMRVFPNEPRDIAPFLDQGFRRTAAHLLRVPYATQMGAGARHLAALADGDRWGMPRYSKVTIPEVVETFHRWPELSRYGADAWAIQHRAGIPTGPHLAVLAQAARTAHRDLIPEWIEGVRTGYNLGPGDPRGHLRSRFRNGLQSAGKVNKRDQAYALIVKAWNAFADDTPMTVLKQMASEPLPTVQGFTFKVAAA